MNTLKYLITLVLIVNLCNAQPLLTPATIINNAYYKNKVLLFNAAGGSYHYISKEEKRKLDKNNGYESYIAVSMNSNTNFIYKKDTMQIKLLFDAYSNKRFEIRKLNFQKGKYIIDLKRCVGKLKTDTYPIIIENFPCDCMAYRKEDEEENKK